MYWHNVQHQHGLQLRQLSGWKYMRCEWNGITWNITDRSGLGWIHLNRLVLFATRRYEVYDARIGCAFFLIGHRNGTEDKNERKSRWSSQLSRWVEQCRVLNRQWPSTVRFFSCIVPCSARRIDVSGSERVQVIKQRLRSIRCLLSFIAILFEMKLACIRKQLIHCLFRVFQLVIKGFTNRHRMIERSNRKLHRGMNLHFPKVCRL